MHVDDVVECIKYPTIN